MKEIPKRAWWVIGGAAILFVLLAVFAAQNEHFPIDLAVSQAIQRIELPGFSVLMRTLTWIGFVPQVYVISAAILLLLYVRGYRWETTVSLLSVLLSSGIGMGVKAIIARPRPGAGLVQVSQSLHDFSFPSGHVLYFVTFFGFLAFLVYYLAKNEVGRRPLLILLGLMILGIGVSRIYLGHHWLSDVTGSYLLGTALLGLTIQFYLRARPEEFTQKH